MNRFPVLALVATLAAVSCLRGTGPVAPVPQHVTVEGMQAVVQIIKGIAKSKG